MQKRTFLVGILVMTLVFGMVVVGCSNGDDEGQNILNEFNWSRAPLSSAAISASGLTQAQFDQINTAAGGNLLGWEIDGSSLLIAWTERSLANFNNVVSVIGEMPGRSGIGRYVEDGIHIVIGNNYMIEFFTSRTFMEDGYHFIPARTLFVDIRGN